MPLDTLHLIAYAWEALGLLWLIGLAFTKRTVRARPRGVQVFYTALAALGAALLADNRFGLGWLGARFVPLSLAAERAGFILTLCGCAFAAWARITLGANWSGRPTVKAGHELVVTGPYALARHPIYTGLMLAVVGSAVAIGQWRCVLGFLLVLLAFLVKMSQEERLMQETFPQSYPAYRRRVRALIPGVF